MANTTESWHITIPALSLPFLATPEPISFDLPISTIKTGMRLVVIISTYLLFRPQLERQFRRMRGEVEPTAAEVQERMKIIEQERGMPIGGGKKVLAVATPGGAGAGAGVGAAKGTGAAATTPGSAAKSRRKA